MKTKYIAFASMKGGVGKTTLNSIIANYIYNNITKNVVVLDADDSQQSFKSIRDLDNYFNEDFDSYPIIEVSSKEVLDFAENNLEGEVEYVIIDLPGNVNQPGVIQSYSIIEYMFIPTRLTLLDVQSTKEFVKTSVSGINQIRKELKMKPLKVRGVVNDIDLRTIEYKDFINDGSSSVFPELEFLNTIIPHANEFSRGINTKKEIRHKVKGDLIKHFCQEVIETIKG